MLCKTLICDLLGEANIILCRFLIFIPVEKVPRDATIIAFFCFSTIPLIASHSGEAPQSKALQFSIITDKSLISEDIVQRLSPIIGKYFRS